MRGFVLKDLVVVITTVAVLILLALVGLRAFNERALRLRCQNNLHEVGMALKTYSVAHDGSLPDCTESNPLFRGSAWPWDMNTNLFNEIVRCGATTNSLYCPANPAMNDVFHRDFWRFGHNSLQVISYGMLFNGIGQEPPAYWRQNLSGDGMRPPAQTELGFDATVSMNGDFSQIRGRVVLSFRTACPAGSASRSSLIVFLNIGCNSSGAISARGSRTKQIARA